VGWPKTYIVAAKVYTQLAKSGKEETGVEKAMDYYLKAIELDQAGDAKGKGAGKFEKEIKLNLTFFKNDLIDVAAKSFETENYDRALNAFENYLKVNDLKMFKAEVGIDTMIVYNSGLAAYNAKNWKKAEKYFVECIDMRYSPEAVLLLHQVYVNTEDSVKMGDNLTKGFTLYNNDDRILTTLINYYLSAKQNEKALSYLRTAIEKDPKNPSFYYATAVLYDQMKDFENAESNYLKSIEIDEKYFNSLYNIGVLYYNKGVEQNNYANDLTDPKAFDAARKVANDYFIKSLPFFERAHEVMPEEAAVLENMKTLYYRFDNIEKYNEVKAKIEALPAK
jgi:tetratricopeptide (TPR) repeat protein